LALAARLSEDATKRVAVIEAGLDGSAVQDKILAPAAAYFGGSTSILFPLSISTSAEI
jgi:choline dehydrogenase